MPKLSSSLLTEYSSIQKNRDASFCFDKLKDDYCKIHGIPLLRISYLNKENDELEKLIL